ncbi:MAG TPA: VCBS repeat-containing protein [Iamia sp.]|nr:VCBS repeat-containing protein [Iamia sp.]
MVLAALVLAAAAVALVARTPAGAAPTDSDTLVFAPESGQTFGVVRNGATTFHSYFDDDHVGRSFEGNFTGNPGTDIFVYGYGTQPDGIVTITPSGTGVTTSLIPKTVNLDYGPVVGDFDGNGLDDILWVWNGPGYGDSLWLFNSNGSHTSVPISVTHDNPTVFDANGDGVDDILWYAPGNAADHLWLFGPGGVHTSRTMTINGNYRVVPGRFGDQPEGSPQERLVFVSNGGYDSIWTFDPLGNHTTAPLPAIDDVYEPVVGRFTGTTRDAILWYRPGHDAEQLWTFTAGGAVQEVAAPSVFGTYDPVVGDFDGNGYQDIAWTSATLSGHATIWRFYGGGHAQSIVSTGLPHTTAHASYTHQ